MGTRLGSGRKPGLVERITGVGNDSIVNPSPHGDNTLYIPATDPGGRRRRRAAKDICGVLPVGAKVGGLSGLWVPKEGKQLRESQGKLHVSELEVEVGDYTGDTRTTTTMISQWDEYASGTADKKQANGWM